MSPIPLGILAASGVSAGAFDLLESTILTTDTSSVTFSNLNNYASSYKHLQLRVGCRTTDTVHSSERMHARFNGVTTSSYAWHFLASINGGSIQSEDSSSTTSMAVGDSPRSGLPAIRAYSIIDILDFSNTNKNKVVRYLSGYVGDTSFSMASVRLGSGLFISTNAITSMTLFDDGGFPFESGSHFGLYGLKG